MCRLDKTYSSLHLCFVHVPCDGWTFSYQYASIALVRRCSIHYFFLRWNCRPWADVNIIQQAGILMLVEQNASAELVRHLCIWMLFDQNGAHAVITPKFALTRPWNHKFVALCCPRSTPILHAMQMGTGQFIAVVICYRQEWLQHMYVWSTRQFHVNVKFTMDRAQSDMFIVNNDHIMGGKILDFTCLCVNLISHKMGPVYFMCCSDDIAPPSSHHYPPRPQPSPPHIPALPPTFHP